MSIGHRSQSLTAQSRLDATTPRAGGLGSSRSLGLSPVTGPSQFLNKTGQVAFSPDGRHRQVTTKANGSSIDVFAVRHDGRPSATFVANPSNTPVPFGIAFDHHHRLVVAEAGASALSTDRLNANGTVTPVASVTNGQAALCWGRGRPGFCVRSECRQRHGDQVPVRRGGGAGTIDALRINSDGRRAVLVRSHPEPILMTG